MTDRPVARAALAPFFAALLLLPSAGPAAAQADAMCGSFCDDAASPGGDGGEGTDVSVDGGGETTADGTVVIAPPPPPPPPPPPVGTIWVAIGGQQAGPFTVEQVRALAGEGRVDAATLVWMDGMPAWAPAAQVPSVASLVGGSTDEIVNTTGPDTAPDTASTGDPAALLIGTWQIGPAPTPMPNGQQATVVSRMTYEAGGAMRMEAEMRADFMGQPMIVTTTGTGTYSVTSAGAGQITVSVDVTGQSTSNMPGVAPQPASMKDSFVLRVVDRDTLTDETGGTMRRVTGG